MALKVWFTSRQRKWQRKSRFVLTYGINWIVLQICVSSDKCNIIIMTGVLGESGMPNYAFITIFACEIAHSLSKFLLIPWLTYKIYISYSFITSWENVRETCLEYWLKSTYYFGVLSSMFKTFVHESSFCYAIFNLIQKIIYHKLFFLKFHKKWKY